MKNAGMGLNPENRKKEGLILIHSILDNLCYASMNITANGWVENKPKRNAYANKQVKELDIKVTNIKAPCSSLSGGNQQKVVVGNWLNTNPKIMLYDEPSRGIDVNAKQQIFEIMWEEARKGVSTIFVSTELEELLEVCHRILIMRHGEIVDEVNPDDLNINELYEMCMQGE
jgi:ABC-type sugar transport system ATPase subunit